MYFLIAGGISERRLSDTISPLAAFSADDLADMDKEVAEIFDESDSDNDDKQDDNAHDDKRENN